MIRKIVISVLVISAGVIAWAGISGLAEWGSHGFGWGSISDRYSGFIGVIGDSFLEEEKGTFSIVFGTKNAYCHGWRG